MAERLGQPLMPWQQLVADVGGELLPDGRPAYRSVRWLTPRQSGKTTLWLAWAIQRARGWEEFGPQKILYSAQTGNDARKKMLEDQFPILDPRRKPLGIRRLLRGAGAEAVEFQNGSRIGLLASAEESGHGKTVDLAMKDELFADFDNRRDQALVPAMATRPFAQVLTASTAGTDASVALNAEVESGRAAVLEGRREGVAYFEWSAGPDVDVTDPDEWWGWMPALGHTITPEVVQHAFDTLTLGEFTRAFGNVPTRSEERVIPAALWEAVCKPSLEVPMGDPRTVFTLDVTPERSRSAVAVADGEGRCELVDLRVGTGWVIDRCAELWQKYRAPFVVDQQGPAAPFIADLEQLGVVVVPVGTREMVEAAAVFFDDVADAKIEIRANPDLDAAVAGAVKRPVGDGWVWARRGEVEVCALVAVTLAHWAGIRGKGSAGDPAANIW